MNGYNPYLSKSLYIKGCQCPKALWLKKYHPELADEISAEQQALFDSGTNVGILAQQLFPDGVLIPYEGLSMAEQLTMTAKAIAERYPDLAEVYLYPAGHGFNCDQRGSWNAAAAATARDRTLAFLARHLDA